MDRREEPARAEAPALGEEGGPDLLLPHGRREGRRRRREGRDDAYADPKDKSGKLAAVDVAPVKKLPRPVTLAEIKAKASFKDFPLVRISRLSVMPVTDAEWLQIERMAGS